MSSQENTTSLDRMKAAREFVESFVQANPRITSAIVVGSVAKGTDGPHSDVDLRLFSTGMQRGDLPLREAGCWQGGVYVDVSEVPDVWLDDPQWIAGCPRHGSSIRFGRVLVDPDGRLAKCLAAVVEVFDRPEYHARRVRVFRDIVEKRLEHARQVLGGQCRTKTHIALGLSIIDASLMPALCVGVSPRTIQSMIQLREISTSLWERCVEITTPAGLAPAMVQKWLKDPDLAAAARARDFTFHVYEEVAWMADQGQTVAAYHLLWALVYFCLQQMAKDENTESSDVEVKATCWLNDVGWSDIATVRGKLDKIKAFCELSIDELFPHSRSLLERA